MAEETTDLVTQASALSRTDSRRQFLARVIDPKVTSALIEAHEQFYGALSDGSLTAVERTLLTASAIRELRERLTREVVEAVLMPLQNSRLGFKTDRSDGYTWDIVRDCAIEAMLRGLPVTGNAFNIIARGMYVTKEGFQGLVAPLCTYSLTLTVPDIPPEVLSAGGHVRVTAALQYRPVNSSQESAPLKLQRTYGVRVSKDNKVAIEATEGKSTRKALRDLYEQLTGMLLPEAEDVIDIEAVRVSPPALGGSELKVAKPETSTEPVPRVGVLAPVLIIELRKGALRRRVSETRLDRALGGRLEEISTLPDGTPITEALVRSTIDRLAAEAGVDR